MSVWCRGIRGATTATDNTRESILEATDELLREMVRTNNILIEDIASVTFTMTPDLDAEFPAVAARDLGWTDTALMCGQEINVPGSLQRCIRILIHWNTTRQLHEIVHVYLRDARNLRPEHAKKENQ